MKDAARKTSLFLKGYKMRKFLMDGKTQSAVIMQLALIGEMAKRISDQTKLAVKVPWKEIAGFRDRAIHDYYQVDLQVVWDTIALDLEPLEKELRKHLGGI